ncbi:MAG: 2-dehydropantoate 2-reductase N-terminal domain-containing protein [Acidimicrobiia bacterium]
MRYVVYGAGAIGGVLGGRLQEAGHDVVFIARGDHFRAMENDGLRIDSRFGTTTLRVNVVDDPRAIDFLPDDVVLLCMKGQHTEAALRVLVGATPAEISVVSVQNGVANEPTALRYFANVYGVCVMCPAVHLEPGVVEASSAPVTGLLDIGRYPDGVDARAEAVSAVLRSATFHSVPRPDIMRWKYGKLLNNLANSIDALCGPELRRGDLGSRARAEAVACLAAAGIAFVDRDEDSARRGDVLRWEPGGGRTRPGASSWQSLARGTGSIEADYLNGEIVMLGRRYGVPTPVNETLQRVANQAAREQWAPASMSIEELIRLVPGSE